MTTKKTNIQKELNRIQKELKAPKNQYNSFGKYNYRNAEDILEAYKQVSGETTLNISDKIIVLGEGENARFYVEATVTLHLEDEKIKATALARESLNKKGMDDSQITGTASSYARKYAMNGLFCIDDTKDADSQNNTETKVSENKNELKNALDKVKEIIDEEELKKFYFKNKHLGGVFAKAVTEQKKLIKY